MSGRLAFASDSEAATDRLGRLCADAISESLTVALNGELGSGKTRFVRSFCEGLGVDGAAVNSPTFVLMQNYEGTIWSVSHFDTYRLADSDEFLALGVEDWFADPNRICLIEWADRVKDVLPTDRINITISQTGVSDRRFELQSTGIVSDRFLEALGGHLSS